MFLHVVLSTFLGSFEFPSLSALCFAEFYRENLKLKKKKMGRGIRHSKNKKRERPQTQRGQGQGAGYKDIVRDNPLFDSFYRAQVLFKY